MDKYTKFKNRQLSKQNERLEKINNRIVSQNVGYNLIDHSFSVKEGDIKFGKGVTLNHLLAMSKICWLLKRINIKFYTELIFKKEHGIGRADIFLPDKMIVVEILNSESISKFEKVKLNNYPCSLEIIPIKAKDVLKDTFKLKYNNIDNSLVYTI